MASHEHAGTSAGAAELGIHRLRVPTPLPIGDVNLYLLEGSPLTLVDTGPNTATALRAVEEQLAELSYRVEDLERVFLTHHHVDHIGLTETIARRSGAEVVAPHLAARYLGGFDEENRADIEDAALLMARHGTDARAVEAATDVMTLTRAFGAPCEVTRTVRDGDLLTSSERDWHVWSRPGHSESDVVLHDPSTGTLISSDHVMERTSSVVVARSLGAAEGVRARPTPLLDYCRSLVATRSLDVRVALPGHGPPVKDVAGLVDRRLAHHDRRMEVVLGALVARPATAASLAAELYGRDARMTHAYFDLSEVLGHLDLLIAAGRAAECPDGERTLFEAR